MAQWREHTALLRDQESEVLHAEEGSYFGAWRIIRKPPGGKRQHGTLILLTKFRKER